MAKPKTNKAFAIAPDLSKKIIPVEAPKHKIAFVAETNTPAPVGYKYIIVELTDGKKIRRDTFIYTDEEVEKLKAAKTKKSK